MTQEDIICAISTSPGRGAIAVIRVSGKGCIELCDSIEGLLPLFEFPEKGALNYAILFSFPRPGKY